MGLFNHAAHLKGITVKLYEKTQTGTDPFNRPVFEEQEIEIGNVLIGRPSEEEITDVLNLTGRKAVYTLGIPKGDEHNWTNRKVSFFGEDFQTIGEPIEGIEGMIPLEWNRKVRCERINGESRY